MEFDDEKVEFDVVEETGPVEYVEEDEEGIGDDDMENLVYEGDPLLNSDYEDGKLFSLYVHSSIHLYICPSIHLLVVHLCHPFVCPSRVVDDVILFVYRL